MQVFMPIVYVVMGVVIANVIGQNDGEVVEPVPLQASDFVGQPNKIGDGTNDAPFIVVNADVLCSYPLRDLNCHWFAVIALGLQWLVYLVHGLPFKSEKYYDASGSLTHLSHPAMFWLMMRPPPPSTHRPFPQRYPTRPPGTGVLVLDVSLVVSVST